MEPQEHTTEPATGRWRPLRRLRLALASLRRPQSEDPSAPPAVRPILTFLTFALIGLGLLVAALLSRDFVKNQYLLIHCLAELFSVLVAWGMFVLAVNSRRLLDNNYLLLMGVAYLFVGLLDLVHTLAYSGMGVIPGIGSRTNPATQLWIAARSVEALSLLLAPFVLSRRPRFALWFAAYAVATALLLAAIFVWRVFPVCFVEGVGLTRFKIFGEYVICLVLAGAIALLLRQRRRFDPGVLRLVIASLLATIAEELAFTRYTDANGPMNLLGHYFKIVSFYLIYRAIIHTALVAPQAVLFRDLQQSQWALQRARDELEQRVRRRTADLVRTVEDLQAEVRSRVQVEDSLRQSEARLAEAQRMARLGNWDWDIATDTSWWSEEVDEMFGLGPEQPGRAHQSFLDRVHPDDREMVARAVREALQQRKPLSIDHRLVLPDGTERFVHEEAEVTCDDDGNPVRMVGTVQDITERKRAEDRVRSERQRLVSLLNMLPGYVVLLDRRCAARFANDTYLDLFGPIGELAPHLPWASYRREERDCPCHRVLETGQPGDWEWTGPDGRTYHAWGYPFSDVDETAVVLELGIDVTEQKRLEKEVLDIGETERQRIGQDLHDTVGQNLTGAAFLCTALAEKLRAGDPRDAADAARIEELLTQAIAQTRSITRGLCLIGTDGHSLAAAIRELATGTEELFGVHCATECDEDAAVADTAIATHLYRIAQEAVNNALKHGRCRNVLVRLVADDHGVRLAVEDDGAGVPEQFDESRGVGLRSMRYRAAMIGGRLRVGPRSGGGTVVECVVPIPQRGE